MRIATTFKKSFAAVAAVTVLGGVPVLTATSASADPSCITSASAKVNAARQKSTVTVTSNPCSRQVRAWAECMNESGGTFQKTSGYISGTGSVTVDCGVAYVNKKGHEVNVPGQGWTRYVY